MSYEKMNPMQLDKVINNIGRRVTIYFIGFCSFFLVTFIYSIYVHYFFSALVGFIFVGLLLVYYMNIYTFTRILRLMQFDKNFIEKLIDNDELIDNDDV